MASETQHVMALSALPKLMSFSLDSIVCAAGACNLGSYSGAACWRKSGIPRMPQPGCCCPAMSACLQVTLLPKAACADFALRIHGCYLLSAHTACNMGSPWACRSSMHGSAAYISHRNRDA